MSVIWGSIGPLIVKGVPTTILMTLSPSAGSVGHMNRRSVGYRLSS